MIDIYSNFEELATNETIDVDFQIRVVNRGTTVAIIAPHGGKIEPGTSEIAAKIAGDTLSFYAFVALRPAGTRGSLHITSTRFDEPQALALVGATQKVVAIHGRADRDDPLTVKVGGLDEAFRNKIVTSLKTTSFAAAAVTHGGLVGRNSKNICNRCSTGAGVQLELPKTLRCHLMAKPKMLEAFCDAIRVAVAASTACLG